MSEVVTLATREEGLRCFEPDHRSYSGDVRWDTCEMRDRLVRFGNVRDWMGPEAVVGSAVDAVVMALASGEDAPSIEAEVIAAGLAMADPVKWAAWDLSPLVEKATALVDLWTAEVQPVLGAVYATQLELHWDVDGIPYHAHLDLVLDDGSVIDLKTSEKRLGDLRADTSAQLTQYAAGMVAVYGQLPPAVGLDGLIYANPPPDVRAWNPNARKPWYDRQRSTRTPAQLAAFREDCQRREEARRWSDATGIYQAQGRSAMEFVCARCPAIVRCPSWAPYMTGATA